MNKHRTILLLILLLVLGVALTWWLSRPADAPGIDLACSNSDLTDRDVSRPLGDGPGRDEATPVKVTDAANSPTDEPTPGNTEDEPKLVQETPITPLYGPAILRGGASATFELLDSNEQPLYRPEVEVALWRRVGVLWSWSGVHWDEQTGRVICNGTCGEGIEAGDYELDINAGTYGIVKHSFFVAKGQRVESVLRTPNYRRILGFRFHQPNGDPVDWIDSYPSVSTTIDPHKPLPRRSWARSVLRSPPKAESDIGIGGRAGGRRGSGGFRARPAMMATDVGMVYVAVIAGAKNTVTFTMDPGIWGADKFTFSGEFLEDQWADYKIELPLNEQFEALTAEHYRWSANDPGRRSLLGWMQALSTPAVIDVESAIPIEGQVRIIVECETPAGAHMHCGVHAKGEVLTEVSFDMKREGKLCYHDMSPGEVLYFGMYREEQRLGPLHSHKATEEKIQRIRYTPDGSTITTLRGDISPTATAWYVRSRIEITARHQDSGGKWATHKSLVDFSYPNYFLGADLVSILNAADRIDYRWEVSSTKAKKWRPYSGYSDEAEHYWTPVSGARGDTGAASALLGGAFAPAKPAKGIALRAIAPDGTPLPWVECSVVDWKKDALCHRLREVESRLMQDGKRPYLGQKFAEEFEWEEESLTEETIEPEKMKPHLGEDFLKLADDKPALAWYARNSAWYDTHRKLRTDASGYAVDFQMELKPGELYVLYAWSNSRNDLAPDVRIVFEATENLTDIGAITLPVYTD